MASTVYFATNRNVTDPSDWTTYGTAMAGAPSDPGALTYGAAFVDGTQLGVEDSGRITAIEPAAGSGFGPEMQADILGAGKGILVFIHGFANSFLNGISRAAYNQAWFKASGVPAADTTVIAFSWPSLGELLAAPPHLLPQDYWTDQIQAGRSGGHIAKFLAEIAPLLRQTRQAGRRCTLLAHSMGNYALQAGVEAWFQEHAAESLFDAALLAAADERWTSFEAPIGGRLSRLPELAAAISVYDSVRDVAMAASFAANGIQRLGLLGPAHREDAARFPPGRFRTVDCAEVWDYPLSVPLDASHQYYRRSPKVRADIAAILAGHAVPGGAVSL